VLRKKLIAVGAVAVFAMNALPAAFAVDVTVSDPDPQVFFDDTDTIDNPDWTLTADQNGVSFFNNVLGTTPVFLNAADNNVGIGSTNPQQKLHIRGTMNPKIRINVSGTEPGFPAYIWDIRGNSSSFAVQDVTAGVTEPLRLVAGAPTDSLKVSGVGNVGIGPASITSSLHVWRSNGTAQILAEETSGTTAPRNMLELRNNGPVGFNMQNTGSGAIWRFAAQNDGFRINIADGGDAGPEMIVNANGQVEFGKNQSQQFVLFPNGNVTIKGTLTENSDVNVKEHFVTLNGATVLAKLAAMPVTAWNYKHDPTATHIGPMAQDFHKAFALGTDDKHIAPRDLASVAVVGVQELHKMVKERDQEITALQQRIGELEEHVSRLASLAAPKVALRKE